MKHSATVTLLHARMRIQNSGAFYVDSISDVHVVRILEILPHENNINVKIYMNIKHKMRMIIKVHRISILSHVKRKADEL